MSIEPDDKLTAVLRNAGSVWRAAQPDVPEPNLLRSERAAATRRPRRLTPFAAVAAVIFIVAGVTLPMTLAKDEGDRMPSMANSANVDLAQWAIAADAGTGVHVQGVGTLLRTADGRLMLCALARTTVPQQTATAGCGSPRIPVVGAAGESFFAQVAGNRAAGTRIVGLYRGGVLSADSVTAYVPPLAPASAEPTLPCKPPSNGWRPGYGLDTSTELDAINTLNWFVENGSDKYTEVWEGHVDGVGPVRNVLVVGTTGDVGPARTELAAQYHGNLCVYRVKYSTQDLRQIVARLREVYATEEVAASIDPVSNRVSVKALALDPPMRALLGEFAGDALTVLKPLLLPA